MTKPKERKDPKRKTPAWDVTYVDPVTRKRHKRTFSGEDGQEMAWTFYHRAKADEQAMRVGTLSARQVAVSHFAQTPWRKVREEFIAYQTQRGKRHSTLKNYQWIIEWSFEGCGWKVPRDIDSKAYMRWLAKFKPATANTYRRKFSAFCNWCIRAGYLTVNVIEDLDGIEEGDPERHARALTFEEFDRLISCGKVAHYRRLWYFVAGRTGLRHNEIERLTWADIDFERGVVRLPASKAKSRRADVVPIPAGLLAELAVAPGMPTVRVIRQKPRCETWKTDIARADIEPLTQMGNAYLKSLRKTYVTHLLSKGVDLRTVQTMARHKNIATTLKHYHDPQVDAMKRAAELIDTKVG